jgi:hypothetical protein
MESDGSTLRYPGRGLLSEGRRGFTSEPLFKCTLELTQFNTLELQFCLGRGLQGRAPPTTSNVR